MGFYYAFSIGRNLYPYIRLGMRGRGLRFDLTACIRGSSVGEQDS